MRREAKLSHSGAVLVLQNGTFLGSAAFSGRLLRERINNFEAIMRKLLLAGAALGFFISPAAADFFVVQDTSTKHCMIVEDKPSDGARAIVSGTRIYNTREDAQAAMTQAAACKADAKTADKAAPKGQVRLLTEAPSGSWSILRLYKQAVYNANNERIGEVDDVLMSDDGRASALVIGVGGFLGIGETHVVVPFNAVRAADREGSTRLIMNSSRDELKAATHYRYDRTKYIWAPESRR